MGFLLKFRTRLNIKLLHYAAENRIDKPLGLYYLVKAKYKNSTFYNYTPYRLSKQTGLHHKTVKRYVNKLIEHNLAEINGKNLVMKKPLENSRTITIQTAPYMSFESILRRIRYQLIQDNLRQQQFMIAVNFGKSFDKLNSSDKKKAIKRFQNKPIELESEITTAITCNSAGRLFGRSRITANRYIHDLIKNNYINVKNKIIRIAPLNNLGILKRGRYYISNGFLMKHCGRSISEGSYSFNKVY